MDCDLNAKLCDFGLTQAEIFTAPVPQIKLCSALNGDMIWWDVFWICFFGTFEGSKWTHDQFFHTHKSIFNSNPHLLLSNQTAAGGPFVGVPQSMEKTHISSEGPGFELLVPFCTCILDLFEDDTQHVFGVGTPFFFDGDCYDGFGFRSQGQRRWLTEAANQQIVRSGGVALESTRYMAPELFDSKGKITEKAGEIHQNSSIFQFFHGCWQPEDPQKNKLCVFVGAEVDVWALGCLVVEVISNRLPHEECTSIQQVMTPLVEKKQLGLHSVTDKMVSKPEQSISKPI